LVDCRTDQESDKESIILDDDEYDNNQLTDDDNATNPSEAYKNE
jgi:hypothetical protein